MQEYIENLVEDFKGKELAASAGIFVQRQVGQPASLPRASAVPNRPKKARKASSHSGVLIIIAHPVVLVSSVYALSCHIIS